MIFIPLIGKIAVKFVKIGDINLAINPETVIMTWIVIGVIIVLTYLATRGSALIPGRRQVLVESVVRAFDDILREGLDEDGRRFLPLVVTLFLFILMSNWMVLVPGLTSPTKDLNTCLGLGLLVFVISHFWAIRKKGIKKYLKGYFEPIWILFPSNVFSEIGKVLSHSFRLFGNIFAGGVIIGVVPIILVKLFSFWGVPLAIGSMPLLNAFFGVFIGGIQAFVFTMLAVSYISVLSSE